MYMLWNAHQYKCIWNSSLPRAASEHARTTTRVSACLRRRLCRFLSPSLPSLSLSLSLPLSLAKRVDSRLTSLSVAAAGRMSLFDRMSDGTRNGHARGTRHQIRRKKTVRQSDLHDRTERHIQNRAACSEQRRRRRNALCGSKLRLFLPSGGISPDRRAVCCAVLCDTA
ncbi:hypothetical protein GQ42DRAFT_89222 [Ramicandelaber brevisporus]|nr:hypothetical protein GQ42DRAFT_89222 [Ramicandelaber brevisporus]